MHSTVAVKGCSAANKAIRPAGPCSQSTALDLHTSSFTASLDMSLVQPLLLLWKQCGKHGLEAANKRKSAGGGVRTSMWDSVLKDPLFIAETLPKPDGNADVLS